MYEKTRRLNEESDDEIRPWLAGFVKEKGPKTVEGLLHGVGALEEKR